MPKEALPGCIVLADAAGRISPLLSPADCWCSAAILVAKDRNVAPPACKAAASDAIANAIRLTDGSDVRVRVHLRVR